MQGSILKLFMPLTQNGVLFGVYDYLLPIMLYCAWSTLAFLDLARAGEDRARTLRWSARDSALPTGGRRRVSAPGWLGDPASHAPRRRRGRRRRGPGRVRLHLDPDQLTHALTGRLAP